LHLDLYLDHLDQEGKLDNALIHIIKRCPTFGRTQLVKTIFFADLIHSNLCGILMFPSPYRRLDYGPASSLALDYTDPWLSPMLANPPFDITQETGGKYTYTPKREADLSDFPVYLLEILDAATCIVQNKGSATGISEFTHKFSIWKNAEQNAIIPEERFQLNKEDCSLLSKEGISITPFAQEFCRKIHTSMAASEIARMLPKLSCSYPNTPQWDEGLDAYLAWDSAMMFCCEAAPAVLDELREKGLALVVGITCSGADPTRFRNHAITCERDCNQICEIVAQTEDTVLSDTEKDSVDSVMQAIHCELRRSA